MECRQGVFAGVFGILILAGCSGGVTEPETRLVPVSTGDTMEFPAADSPVSVSGLSDLEAYPIDIDADDAAGLIVTGLEEIASSHIVSPWLVSVRTFRRVSGPGTSPPGDATVELTQYVEDFPISAHIRFFSESLDTCLIRSDQSEPGVDSSNLPPPGISGGESVIFNTPSGPWYSLNQQRLSDMQRVYRVEDQMPGALPVGASLSIPGDAFPTVSAYPLFEPEPVVRLLPDPSQPLTTESRFSWMPQNQQDHVKIDFMVYDQANGFQGFAASCWVIDDGSYDLPREVLQALEPFELQAGGVSRLAVRYSRVYSRLDLIDGIVFHQRTEVAE